MASLIFLIIDIEILVILPYISSYFITLELYIRLSNTNTRNNDPIQNNNNNDNNNNNNNNNDNNNINKNNNDDFNSNISKYYWKIRKNDIFCFHYFGGVIAAQGVICHPRVGKGVLKWRQIISKHMVYRSTWLGNPIIIFVI